MERKTPWTEQDLIELRRAQESARLEFKESKLLEQPKDKIAETLTKEVSAFANSEGGDVVIGIREKKVGNTRIADDIDEGVDPVKAPREWLRQIVGSNVSPYLPNIRFHAIQLSSSRGGRVAFVISIPPGSTAYQASDKRYYSRSEFECKAMPDHEIRLRMMRGRVAQASFEIMDFEVLTADEEFARRVKQLQDKIQDRKAFVERSTQGDGELAEHVKNMQERIRDEIEHDGASVPIWNKLRPPLGEPVTEAEKREMLKWQIQGQLEEQARLEIKLEAELS
jgi:predicted HTH transcriptional regulator